MTEHNFTNRSTEEIKEEIERRKTEFALPSSNMFLNTIIQRVAKEKEVIVYTIGGLDRIGFITGLDQEWLQLTTTDEQKLVLIQLLNIDFIEETGNTIRTIKADKEQVAEIKKYAQTIFVKAREINRLTRLARPQRFNSTVDTDTSEEEFEDED